MMRTYYLEQFVSVTQREMKGEFLMDSAYLPTLNSLFSFVAYTPLRKRNKNELCTKQMSASAPELIASRYVSVLCPLTVIQREV